MKTNMKAIVVAMVLYGMFAGFAAAESPDAGDTWSTARTFALSNGYNFINGEFTENDPTDLIDRWESVDASVNSYLELYLDGTAYSNDVMASMYDNDNPRDEMQRVYISGGGPNPADYTLDSSPVGVHIQAYQFEDQEYTFGIYMN